MTRGQIDIVLGILGVLAWAPFIIGRATGGDPPFLSIPPN